MKIYNRNNELIIDVQVADNSYRHKEIMGDNTLQLYFSLSEHIEIPVGAYCVFEGEEYSLMRPESLKMIHTRNFEYTVTMESAQSKAKIWKFRNSVDGRLKFSLTAKPVEHLQMFVDNMNMREAGWTIGDCIQENEKLISYSHAFCYEALAQIAESFNTEFHIEGKKVSLRKLEYNKDNPLSLSYGKGKGFKSGVGRSNYGDNPPVEILYCQGGSRNIDRSKYKGAELRLPANGTLKYDGSHFEGEQGFELSKARTYVSDEQGLSIKRADKQLSSYAEDSLDCSTIYPKREGSVSSVIEVNKDNNFYDFIDTTIPDNLNYEDYIIGGEKITVIFQSGMLAGREFDVKYNHVPKSDKQGKRFEIVPQEVDGIKMPNDTYKPVTGDVYAVFHCMLPDSYINSHKKANDPKEGAEWDMFRQGVKYMYEQEEDAFSFNGTLDGIWAKKNWDNVKDKIKLGALILFSDNNFQPTGVRVRIIGIKNYINNPKSPEIELSNSTVKGSFNTRMNMIANTEVLLEESHKDAILFSKRKAENVNETLGKAIDDAVNRTNSKLSKTEADTAEEHITFAKGLTTLNAIIQQLAQVHQLSVADVANIAKLVISGELKSDDYSNTDGFKLFNTPAGWTMEIDNIIARKTFKTLELVVQRVVHQGGMIVQSPAGGELTKFYSESPFVWAFYIDAVDDFFNGDLVLCQTFNKTKRYWRKVDGYNSAQKIIFIRKDDCEANSAPCEVGDIIVVLGNDRMSSRQNARIINVIGDNAPYTADYKGINSYSLQGKLINQIGNLAGVNDPAFGGSLSGVGIYTKNLYAKGDNIVLQSGKSVEQALSPDSIVSTVKPTLDARFGEEYKRTIDTTQLPQNKYYPVLLRLAQQKKCRIRIERPLGQHLNPNNAPNSVTYAKHPTSGFYTLLEWEANGSAWGASPEDRRVTKYLRDWLKENQFAVGSMGQVHQLSVEVVYVRGGSKYEFTLQGVGRGWIEQFFDSDTQPIELFPEGYTYENYIKNRPAYGATEQDRRNAYGRINFAVRDTIDEPQVSTDKQLQQLESKIIQKNDQIKLEIHNSVTEEVKSGLTVSENGLMLLGKQIVLAGTTLARNMVLQAIQAQKAEIARVISDDIIAKKIEVRKDGKEMALIDANTSTVRFGEGANIGELIVNHNGLRCLNKEYKIESDYAGRGRVAHISTWFNEPAVWAQADDDTAIVALSKNHSHKFQSNSTVVAIRGKGGAFFNTSQNDYWRMPGVLWCARINKWGTIEREWGDGIKNVSISKIGTGVYRVSFSYSDMPQIYIPQVVPYTNEYWSSAWINSVSDNNFVYETVDTGQGKRDMGVMLTIFGVPAIK